MRSTLTYFKLLFWRDRSFGFQWPVQLTSLFNIASMTSVNEQLMAPECTIGSWGFEMKWYLMQALPLVFVFGFVLMTVMKRGLQDMCRRDTRFRLFRYDVSTEK